MSGEALDHPARARTRWILPLVLLLCAAACSTAPDERQPSWVGSASADYPPERYVTGVGQAESRSVATERAYESVARVFEAQVTAQARDWESYVMLDGPGKSSHERRLTIDRLTRVSTDKVLENVQVLDGWTDRATGTHYVLAGMDRKQAERSLLERIAELDQAIRAAYGAAEEATDPLAVIRAWKRAAGHLVLREGYNADLRVVRPSGRGEPARESVAELTGRLERYVAEHLVIGVEVTGDEAPAVRRAIMEGLIRQGLPVTDRLPASAGGPAPTEDAGPLTLLAKGTSHVWRAEVPDPMFRYARWCADFVVIEGRSARVVGAVSRRGREGHVTEPEAIARAVRVMQQEVTAELATALAGYIYGEGGDTGPRAAPAACPQVSRDSTVSTDPHPSFM